MKFKQLTLGLTALALAACSSTGNKIDETALITTPQGPVQGVTTQDAGIYNFKGIPYAQAPVGDLRWAPPAPAPKWDETFTADSFGRRCMQPTDMESGFFNRLIEGHGLGAIKNFLIKQAVKAQAAIPMSEDCLFINVRSGNLEAGAKQPVMVWIHGGGHQFGSADTSYYQANGLVKEGVVLVTFNYRLGVFGYMAHPALSADDPNGVSGNYGTLDQIAALEWIRDNISAYGGDPDNVTIFGESAGSWSVTELMSSPLAKGLFHKAIGQSGASTYHLGQMEGDGLGWPSGYSMGQKVATSVGLNNPSATELRAVPAETIMANLPEKADEAFHHIRDGYVFPDNVGIAFQSGQFQSVPMMMGYNGDEASLFYPDDPEPTVWLEGFPHDSDEAAKLAYLKQAFPTQAETIMDLYDLADDSLTNGMDMMGDEIFGVNIRFAARQNEAQGVPSYTYFFSRVPPSKKQTLGAFHGAEIPFVFDSGEPILGESKDDKQLGQIMRRYWTNFAKTGNPNGEGLPNWPEHQGQNWMHLSGNTGLHIAQAETEIRNAKLNALEEGLRVKLDSLSDVQAIAANSQTGPSSDAGGSP